MSTPEPTSSSQQTAPDICTSWYQKNQARCTLPCGHLGPYQGNVSMPDKDGYLTASSVTWYGP